jgi:hypothetical protein
MKKILKTVASLTAFALLSLGIALANGGGGMVGGLGG